MARTRDGGKTRKHEGRFRGGGEDVGIKVTAYAKLRPKIGLGGGECNGSFCFWCGPETEEEWEGKNGVIGAEAEEQTTITKQTL